MSSIISREQIRERARRAFAAGKSRDDHDMNWNAAALPTWLAEYDRLAQQARCDRMNDEAQQDGERKFFKAIGQGETI